MRWSSELDLDLMLVRRRLCRMRQQAASEGCSTAGPLLVRMVVAATVAVC